MFYLMTPSTYFIYGYMALDMVNVHSDSKRNPLLPLYGLLFYRHYPTDRTVHPYRKNSASQMGQHIPTDRTVHPTYRTVYPRQDSASPQTGQCIPTERTVHPHRRASASPQKGQCIPTEGTVHPTDSTAHYQLGKHIPRRQDSVSHRQDCTFPDRTVHPHRQDSASPQTGQCIPTERTVHPHRKDSTSPQKGQCIPTNRTGHSLTGQHIPDRTAHS